jgi:UDP-N-acetylglucosamine/UDP-N-acetyl-alpha-D-glucosaminouronate 4-epimerase
MSAVLVTGGAGFIGSNLAAALVRAGHGVAILDDLSTGRRENLSTVPTPFRFVEGSLLDDAALREAVLGAEVVFHEAAIPSVQRSVDDPVTTDRVNVGGTVRLLEAARAGGVRRVVYAASSSAYGETDVLPKVEDMTPMPLSPYAVSKLAAEHYAVVYDRLYGVETVCLRYFNVYGPNQDPRSDYAAVVPRFVEAALAGVAPTIYGDGLQTRDFCYVEDAVAANLAAMDAPAARGQVVNVAGGTPVSLLDLVAILSEIVGRALRPVHEAPRPGDVRHSAAALERARTVLGWQPRVAIREGLARTVEHFRRAG